MFRLLYKYLIHNKKATIPGVGVFFIERKPAKLDFAHKVFNAPATQIVYHPGNPDADKSMYAFICREKKIDEEKAVLNYNVFVNNLTENLNKYKNIELPGIGLLSQNAEGELFFKGTSAIKDYFPDVAAQRISREHAEHNVLVGDINRTNTQMKEMLVEDVPRLSHSKDNWWIFAIALGIIGVATIVYYYIHNGSLR